MASILDRYGIKEVADVTFYSIADDGTPKEPVLFLDTLKMSTIEQTASTTEARGGKGNPMLISWDYGKEITVNIEDALFSPKSLALMFGDGNITNVSSTQMSRVATVRLTSEGKLPAYFTGDVYDATAGAKRTKIYVETTETSHDDGISIMNTTYSSRVKLINVTAEDGGDLATTGAIDTPSEWVGTTVTSRAGQKVLVSYSILSTTKTVTISADKFPGTYYITGDTYARSDVSGKDQFFQFIIKKAKMTAENTITLEAEGDPSVFNMSLTVLRPDDGEMMKLVQYDLV